MVVPCGSQTACGKFVYRLSSFRRIVFWEHSTRSCFALAPIVFVFIATFVNRHAARQCVELDPATVSTVLADITLRSEAD